MAKFFETLKNFFNFKKVKKEENKENKKKGEKKEEEKKDKKKKKKKNFFLKHWFLSIVFVIFVVNFFAPNGEHEMSPEEEEYNNREAFGFLQINSEPYICYTYGKQRKNQILFCQQTEEVKMGYSPEKFFKDELHGEEMTIFFFKEVEKKIFIDTYVYNYQHAVDGQFEKIKNKIPKEEIETLEEFTKTHDVEWKEGVRFE